MVKIHLSTSGVEHVISTVGGMLGGAIGNGMEAGVDGFETYQDIHNHNYTGAIVSGAETIYHGGEAIVDGLSGNWL
jgi:hypothetical protein